MNRLVAHIRSWLRKKVKKSYYQIFSPINRLQGKQYVEVHNRISIEVSSICNNKCIFCGYIKYQGKKTVMSQELFEKAVNQAVELGYTYIILTPLTGEVFTDKGIMEKVAFLEAHHGVTKFSFTTNFILAKGEQIDALLTAKKIDAIKISIYGHDKESFEKLAQTRRRYYDILIGNLEYLAKAMKKHPTGPRISLALRTYMDFDMNKCNSNLCTLIKQMMEMERVSYGRHVHYTNWAGAISPEDVAGSDIILKDDKEAYKGGACSYLFAYLIGADGKVVCCACRDAYRDLTIGDLNEESLAHITSPDNPRYIRWIENQQNNIFEQPCKDCDMYRSVNAHPHHMFFVSPKPEFINIETFLSRRKKKLQISDAY
jgi:MoaA/NifB/PqqE/SkfB family radical SAM enzyme